MTEPKALLKLDRLVQLKKAKGNLFKLKDDAIALDLKDPLKDLQKEFIFPTRSDIGSKKQDLPERRADEPCLYLCGNSLGLQPRRTAERVNEHLSIWAKKGVTGHFVKAEESNLDVFLNLDAQAAKMMAPIVGAQEDEVAIAETLTANLHLMMAAFYKPTPEKYKIIIEQKAFPSDHYAVESQIIHHGLDPKQAMVCIEPENADESTLTTSHILAIIDQHAPETALILLPGIQYYTGQFLDIPRITQHAHSQGILIGWDLAHAVGNVELSLHDWDVDFAVWCNYKYVNAGPGAVAGMFVHSKHGAVERESMTDGKIGYRPRLAGWWGGDKSIRFQMDGHFVPIPGAQGFQVGNPSALAISSLIASLEVFQLTSMTALRRKSILLTQFLEGLLLDSTFSRKLGTPLPYSLITPTSPQERGAQLSIRLQAGLLAPVLELLERECVIIDERKPDVVRVAPAPLYNSFADVWNFVDIFTAACQNASSADKASSERVA